MSSITFSLPEWQKICTAFGFTTEEVIELLNHLNNPAPILLEMDKGANVSSMDSKNFSGMDKGKQCEYKSIKPSEKKKDKTYLHHCEVSDSFVHPNMKLANGKNGNGEARLFISNNLTYAQILVKKPWKLQYDQDYIKDIAEDLDPTNFRKLNPQRKKNIENNIQKLNNIEILVQLQQGGYDVNRNYIAQKPHRKKSNKTEAEKANIKKWDRFRNSLLPTKTTLQFYDTSTHILVQISHNKNIHKYNKPSGCSFISLEFFNIFEKCQNIEIQTAKNGGEHKERKKNGYFWPVDGYHLCTKHRCNGTVHNPCMWNNYVFEFQGDYWHKNKKDKDLAKKKFYKEKNYNWFEISESEFNNRKKLIKVIKFN